MSFAFDGTETILAVFQTTIKNPSSYQTLCEYPRFLHDCKVIKGAHPKGKTQIHVLSS